MPVIKSLNQMSFKLWAFKDPLYVNKFGMLEPKNSKGNIIPDTNVAYDIGSDTNRFKDLYLSGNTIHLGTSTLSVDANGNFQLSGGVKSQPVLGDDSTVLVDTANSQIPYAVINFDGLPTSDPGTPGQLWRNGNDVKISV